MAVTIKEMYQNSLDSLEPEARRMYYANKSVGLVHQSGFLSGISVCMALIAKGANPVDLVRELSELTENLERDGRAYMAERERQREEQTS